MQNSKKGKKEVTTSVKFQNGTTNVDAPNPTKSIEAIAENGGSKQKADEQPKRFLTKKKIILTFVFMLIAVGFAVITVRPILKVDWDSFNTSVGTGIAQNWGWLWLFLIIVQVFINLNRGFFTFIPRLKSWGYKISYKDYMLFAITNCFIGAVSPANFLSDPYCLFWLRTHGIPTSKTVSMFFTNSFLWQIGQIVVTMPFFIVCCISADKLTHKSAVHAWLFSMICIGVIFDFLGLLFFFLLNWSKRFHYLCSRVFNWLKKKLHMKYHTKAESAAKYKEKAVLKQSFYDSMKDWKTTSFILIAWVVGDMLGLLAMVWCLNLVQNMTIIGTDNNYHIICVHFDVGWTLVCARLAGSANKLNVLPGQAMGYPAALMELLNVYGGWNVADWFGREEFIKKNIVSNSLLAGQIFLGWIPSICGIAGFIVLTKQQIQASNKGQLFNQK